MTDDLLQRLRAATEGLSGPTWEIQWAHGEINTPSGYPVLAIKQSTWDEAGACVELDEEDVSILNFIVAARTLIPEAADRIAALEAEVAALVHDLERLKDSETHHLNRADKAEAENARLRGEIDQLKLDHAQAFEAGWDAALWGAKP